VPQPRRAQTRTAESLATVSLLSSRWIERILARAEPRLTAAQYLALRAISEGTPSGSELAESAGVSGPAASQLITGLADAGLIERRAVAGDRRRQELALSATGRRLLRSRQALLGRSLEQLLGELPPHERHELDRVVGRLEAALSSSPPPRRRPHPPPPPRPKRAP
jgi:DNA-binding MarR family transcriptional regulator